MGLHDDMRQAQAEATRGPRCGVATLLATLPPEDASDLKAAFDDPTLMGTTIAKVLENKGHPVGEWAISRHRRGACRCR